MNALNFLKGKRTYYCAVLGILYVGGAVLGFYELDEKVLIALGFGGMAFLRAALGRNDQGPSSNDQLTDPMRRVVASGALKETRRIPAIDRQPHKQRDEWSTEGSEMIGLLLLAACGALLMGCSTFTTTQTDFSYEEGKPVRQITTKAKARTFWDSKSALASFAATQSDKTQSAKVGGLSQESSGTNALEVVREIRKTVEALPK